MTKRLRGYGLATIFMGLAWGAAVAGDLAVGTGYGAGPVDRTTAVLHGVVTNGPADVTVFWWEHAAPVTNQTPAGLLDDIEGAFHVMIGQATPLQPGMQYGYQVRAVKGAEIVDSDPVGFTTLSAGAFPGFAGGAYDGYDRTRGGGAFAYPQIHNNQGATNVLAYSAHLNGTLTATGGAPISVVSVFWGRYDGDVNPVLGTDPGEWEFRHNFPSAERFEILAYAAGGLDDATDYFYRFYAENLDGEFGWARETATFRTYSSPTVSTAAGAMAGKTVAVLHGELTGGIEADMEYHLAGPNPGAEPDSWDVVQSWWQPETGTAELPNPFNRKQTGLVPGATYAYRLLAENEFSGGTPTLSEWVFFSMLPELTDFDPSPADTAWFGGGSFDGYDIGKALSILRSFAGTLFKMR